MSNYSRCYRKHWIYTENNNNIYKDVIQKYFESNCCLKKIYNNIKFKVDTDFDGCDSFGPESYLYDLIVTWKQNGIEYKDVWHREYWFHGEDNDPFVINDNSYYNDIPDQNSKSLIDVVWNEARNASKNYT